MWSLPQCWVQKNIGFATAPLVTMGCVMMRVCNLDTCPVGVATQNPELRKRFRGKPEYVINFMRFMAQELREYMAKLGIHTVDELVGRSDLLYDRSSIRQARTRARSICLISSTNPYAKEESDVKMHFVPEDVFDFKLDKTIDETVIIAGNERSTGKEAEERDPYQMSAT